MKKYLSLITVLFVVGVYVCSVGAVLAQTKTQSDEFVNAEDVAIAFYKTGGIVPDFKKWVMAQQLYRETPFARRAKIMDEELLRLNTAYQKFNPEEESLSIKTSAFITPNILKNADGTESYTVTIDLNEHKNDVFYLPYVFMEQNFMILPYKLDTLKEIEISEYTYKHIRSLTMKGEKYPFIMRLRPAKADFTQPHLVDGYEQWAFYTDIGALESWTEDKMLIWEYTAPWYLSPQQQEIKNLYDIKPLENNLSDGAVKVFSR